ncbi:MAG: hypothetical protein V4664_01575 [Patescibacteria group bacterium]
MFGLTPLELKVLKRLNTPHKIQDFLDTLAINYEKEGETYMSPRRVLRTGKAHCLEGALLAAVALWLNGEDPLILDLKAPKDEDHVVALYKRNGYWGAISKTNHATVRSRDPIYKTIRELTVSYFHEYFINETGKKTLRSYSRPLNMKKFGTDWITTEDDLWDIPWQLDQLKHFEIFPKKNQKHIRKADMMEKKAGELREWSVMDERT